MRVDITNDHLGGIALDKYKSSYFHFDFINLMIEKELGIHMSLKYGFWLNKEKGSWTEIWLRPAQAMGGWQREERGNDKTFSVLRIDIPFLLTYNLNDKDKKFKLRNVNIGPYIGYNLNGNATNESDFSLSTPCNYLYRFDCGFMILTGIGSQKWQLSFFLLKGLRNYLKSGDESLDPSNKVSKISRNVLGLDLTRVICLSKKDSESENK